MTVLVNRNGHPTSGTTTERTSSRYAWEAWETFYDTTLGQLMVYNGSAWLPADGTYMPVAAVNAANSAQNNATPVGFGFTVVGASDGTKAVVLPTAVAGRVCILKNNVSGQVMKVFPASGAAINALTADAVFNVASVASCMLIAYNATQWYSVPTVAS